MVRYAVFLFIVLTLTGCAKRGEIQYAPAFPNASIHDVWVAKFRPTEAPAKGQSLPPRPSKLRFERDRVSLPPNHQIGHIEWPKGVPDAAHDMVTIASQSYPDMSTFARQVAKADKHDTATTLLFVHGYNYTHGEAVYQMAQVGYDFDVPSPTVLFSWPSAGKAGGYLYDRDSTLIARDQLEAVIIGLTRAQGRRVVILGHSMGNFLIMETLRQIEISGSVDIARKIEGLFMVSPDIDGELFYTQASRLHKMPAPTVILAAKQDRALRLSAFLTGRTNRLGSETDRSAVRDLPVSVVDTSAFSEGGTSHDVVLTSPAAISILRTVQNSHVPIAKLFAPQTTLARLQQSNSGR